MLSQTTFHPVFPAGIQPRVPLPSVWKAFCASKGAFHSGTIFCLWAPFPQDTRKRQRHHYVWNLLCMLQQQLQLQQGNYWKALLRVRPQSDNLINESATFKLQGLRNMLSLFSYISVVSLSTFMMFLIHLIHLWQLHTIYTDIDTKIPLKLCELNKEDIA